MRVLRDNPLPASIAAASIGYMLWSRRSSAMADDYRVRSSAYAGYDDEDIYGASTTERVSDAARDMGRQAREKASALGEQAREKATALASRHARRPAHSVRRHAKRPAPSANR